MTRTVEIEDQELVLMRDAAVYLRENGHKGVADVLIHIVERTYRIGLFDS